MSTIANIKSLEQQAAAAIESGDPADAKRFAQASGMQPGDFQAQLQTQGAEQLALTVQAHLLQASQVEDRDTNRMHPSWSDDHRAAAQREGWDIFDTSGSENGPWQIQHFDDASEVPGAAQLDTDDDALRMVMNGTSAHHEAARRFIQAHNEHEWILLQASLVVEAPAVDVDSNPFVSSRTEHYAGVSFWWRDDKLHDLDYHFKVSDALDKAVRAAAEKYGVSNNTQLVCQWEGREFVGESLDAVIAAAHDVSKVLARFKGIEPLPFNVPEASKIAASESSLSRKLFDALASAHEQLGVVMAHIPDGAKKRFEADLANRGLGDADAIRKGVLSLAHEVLAGARERDDTPSPGM